MRRSLNGKRMLVTGAGSGIGREICLGAGRRGALVGLLGRKADVLGQIADEIRSAGGKAIVLLADVTSDTDRRRALQTLVETWGGLDILVNNAGVGAHGHFMDLSPEILRQIMEVNFFATAEMCRLAVPLLTDGVQPLLVNVGSMTGRRAVPAWTEYSASKYAVSGLTESLRAELVRFGVDVMLVTPGLTKSKLMANLLARKGRLPPKEEQGLAPEVTAAKILDGMENSRRELRIEFQARLLLFLNWLAPNFVDWRMRRIVAKLYAPEIAEREKKSASKK